MQPSEGGYWQRFARGRLARRSVLGGMALAGGGLLGATLVGCGGGDGGEKEAEKKGSSLLSERKDTTAQAKPGGIFQSYTTIDATSLDPIAASANLDRTEASYSYNKLFHYKVGVNEPSSGAVEGELAESWEFSSDRQQLTIKLKPNVKWDPRAPTNSRIVDSADVAYSFDKFHKQSVYRTSWFNDLNPANAFLTNWQTPDKQTFILKMAYPLGAVFDFLADLYSVPIMPVESDGQFDPRRETRGTNAWILDSWKPSQGFEYKKNPNFWIKDRPFLDGWSRPIIPEYAQALAQFRNGQLWHAAVREEDIIPTKKDLPQLQMLQGEYGAPAPGVFFGWNTPAFKDQRVRQALSRLINREDIAFTFSGIDNYEKEGIDIGVVYDHFLGKGWGEYYVDPFGKDTGEGGANFKHDVAEAKKLLSAAGFANGFQADFFGPSGVPYGTNYAKWAQVIASMFAEGGVRAQIQSVDYSGDYVPNYNYGQAFDGWSIFTNTFYGGVANNLRTNFHSASVQDRTMTAPTHARSGAKPAAGPKDEKLDGMIQSLLLETDQKKAVSQAHEIQRYLSTQMYVIPFYFKSRGLGLAQPWIGNYGVYRPYAVSWVATDVYPFYWFDQSKKT